MLWFKLALLVALAALLMALRPVTVTLHSAESGATANGTAMVTTGFSFVTVHNVIAAAWDGTLTMEGSVDNTNYVSVYCVNTETSVAATTGSGNGAWRCPVQGMRLFRARISGRTVGSTTTTGIAK